MRPTILLSGHQKSKTLLVSGQRRSIAIDLLCPDTNKVLDFWCPESKIVGLTFDHITFPDMKSELSSLLSDYQPLIWNDEIFRPTTNGINDPIYNDDKMGPFYHHCISDR